MKFKSIIRTALTVLMTGTAAIAMETAPYEDHKDTTSLPIPMQPTPDAQADKDLIEKDSTPVPPIVKDSWAGHMYKAYWKTLPKGTSCPPTSPVTAKTEEVKETEPVTPLTIPEPEDKFTVEDLTKSALDLKLVNDLLVTAQNNPATQELVKKILEKAKENRKNKETVSTETVSETDKKQLSLFWRMLGY